MNKIMKQNIVKREDILDIYVDGASRGNPGPSAWSYLFMVGNKEIDKKAGYIGHGTNNQAEYNAIINALKDAKKYTRWHVKVHSDSELVVKHIIGEYRIKASHLVPLCMEIYELENFFQKVEFFNVGRNNKLISRCDELCNKCLNEKGY